MTASLPVSIPYYVVDAFADGPFTGNPAGVCPLEQWLPEGVLQEIAAENNLSETAFFVRESDSFRLRWFAPTAEVDLCGHATLAVAHILYTTLDQTEPLVRFLTRSGPLEVERKDGRLRMDLPVLTLVPEDAPHDLVKGLGVSPLEVYRSMDWVCVLPDEDTVRQLVPDLETLKHLGLRGVVVTATGRNSDYVLRCFAPNFGIPEDPVTGSAQTMLWPYWSKRLGKTSVSARQLSRRGGTLACEVVGDRVYVVGHARTYMSGRIFL
jgi:PhzF family phenazine biosynthesis protein